MRYYITADIHGFYIEKSTKHHYSPAVELSAVGLCSSIHDPYLLARTSVKVESILSTSRGFAMWLFIPAALAAWISS